MMFNRGFYRFGLGNCCGSFGGWDLLIGIGLLLGVIALVLWLRSRNSSGKEDSYLEVLKDRFVKGEITEEEYLSKKNTLERK
ncbi:MAG: SHOCT domain-containing protein [Gudongella sp.]|nr:SHOCT domain-containing protein [Gudongella sp.]